MLSVTASQIGNLMALFVLMESNDFPFHESTLEIIFATA
jgi:hypothetical protein